MEDKEQPKAPEGAPGPLMIKKIKLSVDMTLAERLTPEELILAEKVKKNFLRKVLKNDRNHQKKER